MAGRKYQEGPFLYEDPLGKIDRNELRKALVEEAKAREEAFPKQLEQLCQLFRECSPPDLLAITSSYALQATVGKAGVSEHGMLGPKIGQHHIEILQAIALSLPKDEWGKNPAVPKNIQTAFDLSQALSDGFHMRRLAQIETITEPEEMQVRALQERLRGHTQIVRNWGYFSDVVAISRELYGPFDAALTAKFGLSASEIILLFTEILRTLEERSTDRLKMLKRIFRERKPKKLVRAYYRENPHLVGTADEFITEFAAILENRKALLSAILGHSDLALQELMTLDGKTLSDITGLNPSSIDNVLSRLSISPGELSGANPEHFFMDNPVWKRPLLRLSNGTTMCHLAQVFFGFIHEIMGELVEEAGEAAMLSDRRAKYLEAEVARLVKNALPYAKVIENYKWEADSKIYETDVVAGLGSYILILEAKSGTITAPALRGAKDRAKRHVEELIFHPSEQSRRLEQLLWQAKGGDATATKQVRSLGFDLSKIETILRVSVTLTDFNVLTSHEPVFKEVGWLDKEHPLAVNMNVADFRCVLDLLSPAPVLFDYLSNRERLQRTYQIFGDELDWLGLYLATGFNIGGDEGEIGGFHITGMSKQVDAYYQAKDAGLRPARPELRLASLWKETLDYLAQRKFDGWIDCAVALLQSAPYDKQREIEREYRKICQKVPKIWRESGHHNAIIVSPPPYRSSAIVFFAFPEQLKAKRHEAAEALASQCFDQAHIKKAFAFGRLVPQTGNLIIFTAGFVKPKAKGA